MASLTGQQIDQTYQGLIKTSANTAVSFPPASLEDGAGNTIGIKLGDGTGIGAGLITQIEGNPGVAGTPSVSVDGNQVTINKIGSINADGGTGALVGGGGGTGQFDLFDGTFNFGNAFTTTNVDFTNANVTGLSGAAGLVSGTGTDSMQSAASLTTNPAQANTPNSIALGNNAIASKSGIAIGLNANNNSNGGITIGNGAATGSLDEGLAIGLNADCNANAGGIAFGRDSECNGTASIAIGRNSLANNSSGIAMGWNSKMNTTGGSGVAIGFDSQVNAADAVALGLSTRGNASGAVALGKSVTAAIADTVSVKALEVQTDSTPTAGGIIMSDAGGTDRRLNITSAGALQIDSTPVGGGGAEESEGQGIAPQWADAYNIPWDLGNFSVTNASGFSASNNGIHFVAFYAKPGEILDEFYFRVQTAGGTGETVNVGLYKAYEITHGTAKYTAPEYVDTIATGIATDSAGKKSITGLNITLPTDAVGGLYFVAFQNNGTTNTTRLSRWSDAVSNNRTISFDIYRYNGWANYNSGGSAGLPTGQIDLRAGTGGATTDLAVDFAWRYKA